MHTKILFMFCSKNTLLSPIYSLCYRLHLIVSALELIAMRDHRPTLTKELISDSKLSQIQEHAKEVLEIGNALQAILPKSALEHCRVANVRGSHLIIEVANASLKMKLDYDRLNILNQLRSKGYARLISIELKVNPELYRNTSNHADKPSAPARPPISHNAAEALLMAATAAPPKVKARLERLAKLADKSQ